MSNRIKAHIALTMVALIYGLNYSIAKNVMVQEYLTPFGFIMLRVIAGMVLISIFHFFYIKEKMERKDLLYAAFCSFFGVAANMLCFFEGLKHTSSIHASLIMMLTPVLVLIASGIIIKEKITKRKISGIVLGLCGAVILISQSGSAADKAASFYGDMMIMVNAVCYGLYLVFVRRLIKKYNPITVMKWVFFFGAFLVIPFGASDLIDSQWSTFSWDIWLSIIYVLLFTTAIAYLLSAYALSKVLPSTVGFYIYFQPLIASTVAILSGTDSLNGTKIISALLLFIGVFIINKSAKIPSVERE